MKRNLKRIGALLLAMVFVISMVQLRARAAVTVEDAEWITFTNGTGIAVEVTLDPKGGTFFEDNIGFTENLDQELEAGESASIMIAPPEDTTGNAPHYLIGWANSINDNPGGGGGQMNKLVILGKNPVFNEEPPSTLNALWAVITTGESDTEIVFTLKGAPLDLTMTYNEDGTISVDADYDGNAGSIKDMAAALDGETFASLEALQDALGEIDNLPPVVADIVAEATEIATEVYEENNTYSIDIEENDKGTIAIANDLIEALAGSDINFTVTPAAGYEIDTVKYSYTADGESEATEVTIDAGENGYSFEMPAADVTISATYAAISYNVGYEVNELDGGDVTLTLKDSTEPITTATVEDIITVTLEPADGFEITAVSYSYKIGETTTTTPIDLAVSTGNVKFDIAMVAADLTLSVEYTAIDYEITIDENIKNGTVACEVQTANYKDTIELNVTPAEGYSVAKVTYKKAGDAAATQIAGNGGVYAFEMPAADVTVSATFTASAPMFRGHSMLLDEQIGVLFGLILPDGFEAANDAAVEFELSDGRTESVPLSKAIEDNDGVLWFNCHINALELGDTITATFAYGDGEAITDTYSALEYFADAKEEYPNDSKLRYLIYTLQDLGHYMQEAGWKDSDGKGGFRTGHTEIKKAITYVDPDSPIIVAQGLVSDAGVLTAEPDDALADVRFSMTLNSATKINLFVKTTEGVGLASEYTDEVTIDGESYYWIESSELKASELFRSNLQFGITLSNGDSVLISASPMQYLNMMLNSDSVSEADKCALAAFVVYAEAADAYYAAHHS